MVDWDLLPIHKDGLGLKAQDVHLDRTLLRQRLLFSKINSKFKFITSLCVANFVKFILRISRQVF